MADCLGRFGRASHSTSRYQTPPRSWDKSTMHVQCKAYNAGNAFSALQCGLDLARSMFSRRRSISHHPPLRGLLFAFVRRMPYGIAFNQSLCKPHMWRHARWCSLHRQPPHPPMLISHQTPALEAWQALHLTPSSKCLSTQDPPYMPSLSTPCMP